MVGRLTSASAGELAAWIRDGEVSSREVVEAHIAHIRRVNPRINAVVVDRFDEARREADAADAVRQERTGEGLPPLHGVPCTIKECFAVRGMPQTAGLVGRRHVRASGDATAVARLRRAGAIPLGVTNLSELCMWMESSNRVYGRSNNPYDPRRIVGGSSGGEGAIVGAGGSPFGLGADIGGSIRMPAFFNGVFGHKPTGGLIPSTGHYPLSDNEARRYLTIGPIARRARDLWPLIQALAGPDGEDPACDARPLGDPDAVDVKTLRVVDVVEDGRNPVHPDLREAQAEVAAHLRDLGCEVRRVSVERLRRALEIWSCMLAAAGGPSFSALLGQGAPIPVFRELGRWCLRRSPHTLPALGLALVERIPELFPAHADRMVALGRELREELLDLIGGHGVMLYPSYPEPAPFHGRPMLTPTRWVYTAILNVMELPATQVPLGLNREGVPLGVQVAAAHGNDHLTVAVAQALEEAFGGWVPPERA